MNKHVDAMHVSDELYKVESQITPNNSTLYRLLRVYSHLMFDSTFEILV